MAAAVKNGRGVALYRSFYQREEYISNFHSKDLGRLGIKKSTVKSPTMAPPDAFPLSVVKLQCASEDCERTREKWRGWWLAQYKNV